MRGSATVAVLVLIALGVAVWAGGRMLSRRVDDKLRCQGRALASSGDGRDPAPCGVARPDRSRLGEPYAIAGVESAPLAPLSRTEARAAAGSGGKDARSALRQWAREHKARVRRWEERSREKEGPLPPFFESEQERRNRLRNERRGEIARETAEEIDHELQRLLWKGEASRAEVERLIARKEHEFALEAAHGINLTDDRGTRERRAFSWKKGDPIYWSEDELLSLESTFAQLPRDHVATNERIRELHRSDMKSRLWIGVTWPPLQWEDEPIIGGDYADGTIRIFDYGIRGGFRLSFEERELADEASCALCDWWILPVEEAFVHEFGHSVHDQHPEAFKAYQEAAGWEMNLDEADLRERGITERSIAHLREGEGVRFEGTIYFSNRYDGGFVAYDDGAIPTDESWDYGRLDYREHFAEHYAKAILVPETLYEDMIAAPERQVRRMERELVSWTEESASAKGARSTAVASRILEQVREGLAKARHIRDSRRRQFRIMRRQVFGAPELVAASVERLRRRGVPPARIAEFEAAAERAHTAVHIEFLERRYRD